ncbi:MAG TPA: TonB C-terminal domain-containing protein [Candidatus Acidoferrum sp.]|nr:TonB C-terminal domain-containing protein [Candidatus Acidoferrum sp.]
MIPRSLVPFDARPSSLEPSARRRPSTLDDRTLVPAGLAPTPLETKSNIPSNLPLESIAERFVVPRDVSPEAYSAPEISTLPPQPSDLDERTVVPLGAASPEFLPPPAPTSDELVEKDIFLTGEVNFLANEEVREKQARKNLKDRAYSILLHAAVILLLIFQPKLFNRRPPSAAEQEIARKQMVLLLPPGAFETARPEPRNVTPPPRVKVDPRVLRKIAPPEPTPEPQPQPVQPKVQPRELPSAPVPQPNSTPPPPAPTPKPEIAKPSAPKLETPEAPVAHPNLTRPKASSNPLRDTIQDLSRSAANRSGGTYAPDPRGGLPPGALGRQGGGGPGIGMGPVQILTPTEGVDFNDYIQRVIASVRRNWYAVMPESAQLGDKGIVVLEFSIHRDGSVPGNEPDKLRGSGKEPLDRAAISAIRSSNPFDHLPPAFTGPEIRLRFIFLYNLPVEAVNQ